MVFAPTADRLYGGGPAIGEGNSAGPSLKAVTQGNETPRPDMRAAPEAANRITSLLDDPTFWLVATVGAVVYLAAASA